MSPLDPLSVDWSDDEVGAMHALRDWAVAFEELNRHLATWTGLPGSDANALGQVVWAEQGGHPLCPAELARRIGMTTGATSILVDRLVAAGHVGRHREGSDRRRVTLRPTEHAREETRRFLAAAGAEFAATVRDTDAAELRTVRAFLVRMTAAASAANQRLAGR